MKAPQIIFIALTAINLLYIAYMHEKPREGKHSLWIAILSSCITFALLFAGGFFN